MIIKNDEEKLYLAVERYDKVEVLEPGETTEIENDHKTTVIRTRLCYPRKMTKSLKGTTWEDCGLHDPQPTPKDIAESTASEGINEP